MRFAALGSNGIADLIDHEQWDQREALELGLELALALGFTKPCEPRGSGRGLHMLARRARPDTKRGSEVRLAGARRSGQNHVLVAVEEVKLAEMLDHLLLGGALEGEVELLQCLACRGPGGLDPVLPAMAVPRGDLRCEQRPPRNFS
jgi:hypothetical protein